MKASVTCSLRVTTELSCPGEQQRAITTAGGSAKRPANGLFRKSVEANRLSTAVGAIEPRQSAHANATCTQDKTRQIWGISSLPRVALACEPIEAHTLANPYIQ